MNQLYCANQELVCKIPEANVALQCHPDFPPNQVIEVPKKSTGIDVYTNNETTAALLNTPQSEAISMVALLPLLFTSKLRWLGFLGATGCADGGNLAPQLTITGTNIDDYKITTEDAIHINSALPVDTILGHSLATVNNKILSVWSQYDPNYTGLALHYDGVLTPLFENNSKSILSPQMLVIDEHKVLIVYLEVGNLGEDDEQNKQSIKGLMVNPDTAEVIKELDFSTVLQNTTQVAAIRFQLLKHHNQNIVAAFTGSNELKWVNVDAEGSISPIHGSAIKDLENFAVVSQNEEEWVVAAVSKKPQLHIDFIRNNNGTFAEAPFASQYNTAGAAIYMAVEPTNQDIYVAYGASHFMQSSILSYDGNLAKAKDFPSVGGIGGSDMLYLEPLGVSVITFQDEAGLHINFYNAANQLVDTKDVFKNLSENLQVQDPKLAYYPEGENTVLVLSYIDNVNDNNRMIQRKFIITPTH